MRGWRESVGKPGGVMRMRSSRMLRDYGVWKSIGLVVCTCVCEDVRVYV